jgi:hypothetical protein
MALSTEDVVRKIDAVLERYMSPTGSFDRDRVDANGRGPAAGWLVSSQEAVERFAPPGSWYLRVAGEASGSDAFQLELVAGVLQALRADYQDGLLVDLTELVHADLFDEFLDMAEHLLDSGYKGPAAVLAGGVLEEQLRKLSCKFGVPTTKESGESEKAESMNASLAKLGTYTKTEQKQVTAWLGLRNDAAHAKHDEFLDGEVTVMIQGLRGFVLRHPA